MSREHLPEDLLEALAPLPPAEADQLERVWRQLGPGEGSNAFPAADEAWRDLSRRIDASPAPRTRLRRDRPARRGGPRYRLALAVFALVAIVVGASWLAHRPVTVTAPTGAIVEHVLPDGSEITLAPSSAVRYARGFREWPLRPAPARMIALAGEAFFEVAAAERPLLVETHDAQITVLGTAFNVRARPRDTEATTSVAVMRGSIRLTPRGDLAGAAVVTAGQRAELRQRQAVVSGQRIEDVGVWREGGFSFHELPLADVLREIERRFDITIWAADDLPYTTALTLFYRRSVDAETLLHDVALAAGLEYRPIRGGYEVSRPTPRSR